MTNLHFDYKKLQLAMATTLFVLLHFIGEVSAQKMWVGIAFTGDMKGEKMRANGNLWEFEFEGSTINKTYQGIGVEDSLSFRNAMSQAVFEIKNHDTRKYKKIILPIPPGFGKHLVFERDKSLQNGEYFKAHWTDLYPFEDEGAQIEHALRPDTANHKYQAPKLRIEIDQQILSTALFSKMGLVPGQLMMLNAKLIVPSGLQNFDVALKDLQIVYAYENSPIEMSTQPDAFAILSQIPFQFKMEHGYRIIFNATYDYKLNNAAAQSGMVSMNVTF